MPRLRRRGHQLRDRVDRFRNPFAKFTLRFDNFYEQLPTREDQLEFQREFPELFWKLFCFEGYCERDAGVFQRVNFLDFLDEHRPRVPFDPPNAEGRASYAEWEAILTAARAEWWQRAGLPMTQAETEWVATR